MLVLVVTRGLVSRLCSFFFNDTATTEIYTLSLHNALPISRGNERAVQDRMRPQPAPPVAPDNAERQRAFTRRSEEHTSELQSRQYLVCRLLLEKKKKNLPTASDHHSPLDLSSRDYDLYIME